VTKLFTTRSLILISALLSLFFYLHLVKGSNFLYIQYDAYYYSAVADGKARLGQWTNIVTEPPSDLRTPQNGVIVIHDVLRILGVKNTTTRLYILSALNALLIVVIAYLSYRFYLLAGISTTASWLLGLTIPLTFYYYMVLLQPINDAIFVVLSLSALLLTVSPGDPVLRWRRFLLIATFICFFRLAGFLVFLAPALYFLLQKKHRNMLFFVVLCGWSIVSPVVLNGLLGFERTGMDSRATEILDSYDTTFFVDHLHKTLSLSLPEALLRVTYFTAGFTLPNQWIGLAISLLLLVLLTVRTRLAILERNSLFLTLSIYIGLNLAFFQIHPAQPTRYILILSPLLPVLFYFKKGFVDDRVISVGFLTITILISTAGLFVSLQPTLGKTKRQFSERMLATMKDAEYELVSYFPRVTYFLLQKSAIRTLTDDLNGETKAWVVVGPDGYHNWVFGKIKKANQSAVARYLPMSYWDYRKAEKPSYGFDYERIQVHASLITIPSEK
jgi:hypothetical protein